MIKTAAIITALTIGAQQYPSQRPAEGDRLFTSSSIEQTIDSVTAKLRNPKLSWMFANCFPNTLDTTVHYREDIDGNPDTFVYTGDIHAMWLRDSGAQVWPYVRFAAGDEHLRKMIAGVINRQFLSICIDPYANAFNDGPTGGHWMSDNTDMNPNDHERKWEIDSHCYPIRLAHEYWKVTGDTSVFSDNWLDGMRAILRTFKEQQRKESHGPYTFTRVTNRQLDTKCCNGLGNPVRPCGLIASSFRPSDDATTFEFLVPSNFFAVSSLRKAAEILSKVNHDESLAAECRALADEVEAALHKYAVVYHPEFGNIYAFEVDGFGNAYMMDDANAPSLLSMAYLGDVPADDPIYQNTRRFVLSGYNPYFFKGSAAEGIGGPHIGYDMIWPMSIMMRAFTSDDDTEIRNCIITLMNTDADTGFMHESFHKDDPSNFTRAWFAWQNTLFGELILHIMDQDKLYLLNTIILDNEGIAHGPICGKPFQPDYKAACEYITLRDQGLDREAYLYLPDTADPNAPLVIMLHGYTGHALDDGLRFMELAKERGWAVCYPQGAKDPTGNNCWNVGYPFQKDDKVDDVAFINKLVRHIQKTYKAGMDNVFLTGMSNGGEMCYKMAAESPETFNAIASIAGLMLDNMSKDFRKPVPFMEVHGTADAISNWEGDPLNNGGWGAYLPVLVAISHMVAADRCTSYSVENIPAQYKKVTLHKYGSGAPAWKDGPQSEVLLYEVSGGDHSWSDRYIDTCALVMDFFSNYLR